ncbi:MAG: hypothetical protein H0U49_04945 [Parachlamydiaceae bacterium]|nr:hypothetical protein [Parachlamydiaceae bacterium]
MSIENPAPYQIPKPIYGNTNEIKQKKTGVYGEPPGIDYGKICSKMYQLVKIVFNRSSFENKNIQMSKTSLEQLMKNPVVISLSHRINKPNEFYDKSTTRGNMLRLEMPANQSVQDNFKNMMIVDGFHAATANVGMDGGLSELGKELKQKSEEEYLQKNFETLTENMALLKNDKTPSKVKNFKTLMNKMPLLKNDKTPSKVMAFRKDLGLLSEKLKKKGEDKNLLQFVSEEKELLMNLADFLQHLENRRMLKDSFGGDQATLDALKGLNAAVFSLYNFSKIQEKWESQSPDEFLPLSKYIAEKEKKIIDSTFEQLKNSDVCFFQEYTHKSLGSKVQSMEGTALFSSSNAFEPSLMINTNRFQVESLDANKQKLVRAEKKTLEKVDNRWVPKFEDYGYFKTEVQLPSVKDPITLKVFEDHSFGTDQFRAVLATDRQTGKKMLLCSIHVHGYEIGEEGQHKATSVKIANIHRTLEKIALDNGIDGIVIGGDFNSVEERVGNAESPLNTLKASQYTQVKVAGDTEMALPSYFHTGYDLSRKIDHIFIKWLSDDGKELIAKELEINKALKGPLKQQNVFDHKAVHVKIGFRGEEQI